MSGDQFKALLLMALLFFITSRVNRTRDDLPPGAEVCICVPDAGVATSTVVHCTGHSDKLGSHQRCESYGPSDGGAR